MENKYLIFYRSGKQIVPHRALVFAEDAKTADTLLFNHLLKQGDKQDSIHLMQTVPIDNEVKVMLF